MTIDIPPHLAVNSPIIFDPILSPTNPLDRASNIPIIFHSAGPLTEIVKYLGPSDVGSMLRVCKRIHDFLTRNILMEEASLPNFLGHTLLPEGKKMTLQEICSKFEFQLFKNLCGAKQKLIDHCKRSLLSLVNLDKVDVLRGYVYNQKFTNAAVLLIKNTAEVAVANDYAQHSRDITKSCG